MPFWNSKRSLWWGNFPFSWETVLIPTSSYLWKLFLYMFRFQLHRTMTPGSSENFYFILIQAVSFIAESNSVSLIFYHRSKLTSIITDSALLWCWKSAWNISSCSHLATQVDIWVFSCSIYSSRGVVKFHFNTCKRQYLELTASNTFSSWQMLLIEHFLILL